MDLAPVAHLSAIQASMGFINFFDGFRTSHEIQKLRTWDYETLKGMVDWDAIDGVPCRREPEPGAPLPRGAMSARIFSSSTEGLNSFAYNPRTWSRTT